MMALLRRALFMDDVLRKRFGAYYTPEAVAATLVNWAVRSESDRLLDPSCGDGRFLACHKNSVGIEQDPRSAISAAERAPLASIHDGDFFSWASNTPERFDCAAGNPPFIRYQRFNGDVRKASLNLCRRLGVRFSSLASSWAPFLVATASLLKPSGRMAFIVPAEIGHAPYASPLLKYLTANFRRVQIIAIREKIFPDLSEDCWLLYTSGYGSSCSEIHFTKLDSFVSASRPPQKAERIPLSDLDVWHNRLRPFLLSSESRRAYLAAANAESAVRFGAVAQVGIGYVTGANDFFHLRPSKCRELGIPDDLLHPAVRNGRAIRDGLLDQSVVRGWIESDQPVMLLKLKRETAIPETVIKYLQSAAAREAKSAFKCRTRHPWYVVPDVTVPDAFLSYMAGDQVSLVANEAGCVGTNSVHVVRLNGRISMSDLLLRWKHPVTKLSCELEGHPLGGGMLKIEPAEASRLLLCNHRLNLGERAAVSAGIDELRRWRLHG
jgi:adenine-specific DNA-methyltransferase